MQFATSKQILGWWGLAKFDVMYLNSGPQWREVEWFMLAPPSLHHLICHHHHHHRHLLLSHGTMRIHFSLIAGISGNKGNERAASYGLIHQELIEASLVSSADRAGVVLECAVLYGCVLKVFMWHSFSHPSASDSAVCVWKWTLRKGVIIREKLHICVHLGMCVL